LFLASLLLEKLNEKRLLQHLKEIEILQNKYPDIKVFKGAEVSILKEGKNENKNNEKGIHTG